MLKLYDLESITELIPKYVESAYWDLYKEYRQSDEYRNLDTHEKFETCIKELGAYHFENFLKHYQLKYSEEE